MQDGTIFIIGAIVAVIAIVAFLGWYFSEAQRTKRALRALPRQSVARISPGSVAKAVGRVKYDGEPLEAPLSGRACAMYEVVVEEYRRTGRSGSWREIIREKKVQNFWIVDGKEHAFVAVNGASMALTQDKSFASGTFNDASPELEKFLKRHGKSSTGLLGFNKSLRYKEAVLSEGEPVAVAGLWEKIDGGEELRVRAGREQKLYVSDDASVTA